MNSLRPYLGCTVFLLELSLIVLMGWLYRMLVVNVLLNRLPSTIVVEATELDSRWIVLPVAIVLIIPVVLFLHKRLHRWLSEQGWWTTENN